MNKKLFQKLIFSFFAVFLFALFSCENGLGPDNTYIEETAITDDETPARQKAYITFNLVESQRSAASRAVTSAITSSLFSDITFSGSSTDSSDTVTRTAASFSELAGQTIEVTAGNWTFTLEAYLGKTDTNPGEKYTASQSKTIAPGNNQLQMKLAPDSSVTANPTAHPGDWEVTITFPNSVAAPVDRVEVALYGYADFTSSTATPLYSKTFVTGTDYEATGPQTLTAGESSRATGNYIVYVRFLKNVSQQGTDFTSETLSTWSEFMRINPGASSSGTIALTGLDASYTITYNLGGAQWNPSSTESIPICYTRKTLASGAISLPGTSAGSDVFVDRGSLYQFLGWYTSPDFADGTGPVTNISTDSTGPKTFYAKWHEPVFDIYISASGIDGSPNDGTKDKPYKTATYAYSKFDDPDATDSGGNIRNTIHILSDYTGDNKITSPWGDSSISDLQVKFVGEKNKTEEAPVTLEVNVNSPAYSFIYLAGSQKMKFSYIDIISSATVGSPNGHGCLFAVSGTELYFENSSIKGYTAEGCSAIDSEGKVYLKDCEISGNTAVDGDPDADKVWGCAVNVGTGEISISGQVVIKDNETVTSDSSHAHADESYNLYLGTDNGGSPVLHHVEITDAITGSEIWVKLANGPEAFTTGYSTHMGTTSPASCFYNDNGLDVIFDSTSTEADLSKHCTVYVSSTSSSPAGDNTNGKGTLAKPYASLEKAIKKITDIGSNQIDATIYVSGDVPCNTTIIDFTDPSMGAELKAKSLTIEGRGTGSTWQEKAAQSILNGDTDGDGTGDGCILDISVNIPFTFKNLTFKDGNTSYSGGALSVGYTVAKSLNISECIFENNKADNGGAVKTSYANSTITNVEVKSNSVTGSETANGEGGGFYFAGGSHTLTSVTFDGNKASRYGGAISTDKNAITSITIEDCTLKNNQAVLQGGAIYISSGSSVTMSGTSSITDNFVTGSFATPSPYTVATNKCGGGVFVDKNGTFIMNAGTISGNGAWSGGAVYTRGRFDLLGGLITSNKRVNGSATNPDIEVMRASVISSNVEVGIPGTFNMKAGEITASSTMTKGINGAAVCVYASSNNGDENGTATFNMEGGEIHGFTITENAAVCLQALPTSGVGADFKPVFNMSGGKIYENTSTASTGKYGGGGLHLGSYASFIMTGGEIYENKAERGGGVFLEEIFGAGAPKVTLGKSGSTSKVTIKNNKEGTAEIASNLYLQVGDVIKIEGPLDEASEINLTRPFAVDTFTQDFSTYNTAFEPGTVFVSDAGYSIVKKLNEASFAANNGSVYTGLDYIFTLSINKNQVEKGMPAAITVIPSVKRKEAGDTSIDLYYNPADQMLYEDSAYTVAAGGDNTVTFEGSLWCGDYEEEDTVTAGSGDEAGKLIISALTFADDYKLNVTVTYMGVAHDATFNILCREPENISSVTSKTYNESSRLADSNIFIANRSVTMKKLAASDHEVTQQEYEKYCSYDSTNKVNATNGLGANYPVYYVSWYDAIVYCNLRTIDEMGIDSCVYTINGKKHPKDWPSILGNATDGYRGAASELSVWNNVTIDLDAAGWRLPTELEWEYLARGGNLSADGQTEWSGSSYINEVAYYEDSPETNSGTKAHEIKGKKQNALGLYDMTGNVFEWVSDWYLENMISSIDYSGPTYSEARDPYGKKEKNFRGGAYSKNAADSRLANRGWHQPPNMRFVDIGFRVVRTIK